MVAQQLGAEGLVEAHAQLLAGYQPREPSDWPSLAGDGYLSENLAYHLACAGRSNELLRLLTDLGWLRARLESGGPMGLLADYAHLPDDPAAQMLAVALRMSAPILADDPTQLPGQLTGRLEKDHYPALDILLDQAAGWVQEPWLRPSPGALSTPYGPLQLTLWRTGQAYALAVAPDGRVVSGGADGTVRVWDLDGGEEKCRLQGDSGPVNAVAVGSDGWVVSGNADGTVRVWNPKTGRELSRLEGDGGSVHVVAVAPGSRVVFGTANGTMGVLDLVGDEGVRLLDGDVGSVHALAVAPNGKVVYGGEDGTVRVCDLETGRDPRRLEGHSGLLGALAVAPDGRVVSGGTDGTVRVWDLDSGVEMCRL